MVTQKELQEKVLAYRLLEARLDGLMKHRDMIGRKLVEIETTLSSINELQKSKDEVLFPIGSEAYTFGKVVDKKKMIVEIGANVAIEKTVDEGKEILNRRKIEIENALNAVEKDIGDITESLEQIAPELQEMIEESKAAG